MGWALRIFQKGSSRRTSKKDAWYVRLKTGVPRFRVITCLTQAVGSHHLPFLSLSRRCVQVAKTDQVVDRFDLNPDTGAAAGQVIDIPRCRPSSHETLSPRTVAASCCPNRCSITGFQGTRLNPIPSLSIA